MNIPLFPVSAAPETEAWQLGAARQLDQQQKPGIRMSGAAKCPRQLAYIQQGLEPTDPPDTYSLNRMALGHMAEILILQDLHRQGWETQHTVLSPQGQLEVSRPIPNTDLVLFGHPDGTCRHQHFTRNMWVTLECKSMSVSRAEETLNPGVAATYPDYIIQIALYGEQLHAQGLAARPDRGVFAMMDRDGAPLPPERVQWNPQLADQTMTEISAIIEQSQRQELLQAARQWKQTIAKLPKGEPPLTATHCPKA